MKVDNDVWSEAIRSLWLDRNGLGKPYFNGYDALRGMGVTSKQLKRFTQTGKLKVHKETAYRLLLIGRMAESPYRHALIKAWEAKHGR